MATDRENLMDAAGVIAEELRSTNVPDSNLEVANLVDVGDRIATALFRMGDAITPCVAGSQDATGGHIESLTESVMGVTAGLVQIAVAIDRVADAMEASDGKGR